MTRFKLLMKSCTEVLSVKVHCTVCTMRFEKFEIRLFGNVRISELCTLKRELSGREHMLNCKELSQRCLCLVQTKMYWPRKVKSGVLWSLVRNYGTGLDSAASDRGLRESSHRSRKEPNQWKSARPHGGQTVCIPLCITPKTSGRRLYCDLEKSFSKGSVVARFWYSRSPVLYVWIKLYRTFKFTLTAVCCLDWMHP